MTRRRPSVLIVAGCLVAGGAEAQAPPLPRVTLEEVGVRASYGLRQRNTVQWAALTNPLDAAFIGDRVAVLDVQAPWIRIFDGTDSLVATAVPRGTTPGQTQMAYSLSSTPTGHVLVAHRRGVERVDGAGRVVGSLPGDWPTSQTIGAVEACGGDPLLLIESLPGLDAARPGDVLTSATALVRVRLDEEVLDTLASFTSVRLSNRLYHPWLADVRADRLVFHSEETEINRLVEVSCDGDLLREMPIESVRSPQHVRTAEGMMISSRGAPFAAGLVRLGETLIWATREIRAADSVTVVTTIESGDADASRRLAIEGWVQMFDTGPEGDLLVGNAWTFAMNPEYAHSWRSPPAVLRLDGANLLRLIAERGVQLP